MPDTGGRREIQRFANAKEAETVKESKKLESQVKQESAKKDVSGKARSAQSKKR